MIKLFLLVVTYMVMIIQLITVLSTDYSKVKVYAQTDLKINLLILLALVFMVGVLSRKLIKEMLAEK
ncbi:putative membrane protein [Catalinimonas alkaloidigena]|uniref:hypothetical protein n=1 Tax=Catalinimonas alkaloidigena TaxID=1075417 RepID=UPI00240698A7|nr:hypothetical protein [Catalinimonas alkaloidigena]MDF9796625.1 putative membrane protein [Catalinimonas alkaloidigena]